MNILLSHSYFLRFDEKAWRQMKPYPPLGTLYAASVLRDAGHTVHLFDTMLAQSEEEIVPLIEEHRPDLVLFYEDNFNYLSKMCLTRMRQACFRMARFASERGCRVIAQGSDPVDHLQDYFANGIDIVVCGEGEQTIVELVGKIAGDHPAGAAIGDTALQSIDGIAFRSGGNIVVTRKRALIRELDALPFPAWDLVEMDAYRSAWIKKHGYFSLNLVTTRGCPFHCNWCAKPVYGQVYNSRSARNVAEELALLRERYEPDHIWFADDILGLKPGWLRYFAHEVKQRGVVTPFTCQTRADLLMKEDNVQNMADAGAQTVWIGAESGSQSVLDAMDKGTTIEQITESTRLMQQMGIQVAWFLQFGYLGETESDVFETIRMVRKRRPDDIGISVSYPLPGTPFYDRVKSLMHGKTNWVDSGDLDLMYPGRFPSRFYRSLHSYVHRSFRLRQGIDSALRFRFSREHRRRIMLIPLNLLLTMYYSIRMTLNMNPGHTTSQSPETAPVQS